MIRLLAFLSGTLLVVGCGDSKPSTESVSGKVMFRKSKPAEGALVVFHPVDPAVEALIGGKPVGTVDKDGNFKLTTYQEGDGAPAGEYGVTIDWRQQQKKAKFGLGDEGGGQGMSMINAKYSNPSKPFTTVTVKEGQPNEFTFDVD